jgi:hypothetical protein
MKVCIKKDGRNVVKERKGKKKRYVFMLNGWMFVKDIKRKKKKRKDINKPPREAILEDSEKKVDA